MTFVYPLLLGGLVLAGLPVVLHFLIRKKPKTLIFPAYQFLVQKKPANTRKLQFKHLLLLLMRIALIVLVCLALARPRIFHESIGLLSREKPVALALVFDTTPSMEYKSGEQTRLDLAKRRALDLLDQLPDDCRVLILDAADPASFAREDWHKSLETARQRIQSLTIRPESVPVNDAINEAQRRFASMEDADIIRLPRFVCVFSDRTKASWRFDSAAKRETDVQMLYFDVGIDEPVDFAVVNAELGGGRQSFLSDDKIPINVAVRATGVKMDNAVVIKYGDNGKEVMQNCPVEAGKERTFALEIDTAELKPGLHHAAIQLQTTVDAWAGNNQRFVTFRILEKPRVLVLTDEPKRLEYFQRTLESLNYAPERATIADKPDLRKYDAVFLVNVASPPEQLWLELAKYTQEGRGVCVIPPGGQMDLAAYNIEAAQKVLPATIENAVDASGWSWSLFHNDMRHPFMVSFRKWFEDGDNDVANKPGTVSRYWKVTQHKKGVEVIAAYDQGDPAIVERVVGKAAGKVVLLTTPIEERTPEWNNYNKSLMISFYFGLTMSCARYLCAEAETAPLNFQFGRQMPRFAATGRAFPKYVLSAADFSEDVRLTDKGVWSPDRLTKPGNYTLSGVSDESSDATPLYRFSINLAPEESDLSRVSVAEIEMELGKNTVIAQDRRRSLADSLDWDEPVELFPWLMIALLFLLALENLLANRFYRSLAV